MSDDKKRPWDQISKDTQASFGRFMDELAKDVAKKQKPEEVESDNGKP